MKHVSRGWAAMLAAVVLLSLLSSCAKNGNNNQTIFIDINTKDLQTDIGPEIDRIEFFQISDEIPIDKISNLRMADDRVFFMHRGGRYSTQVLGIVAVDLEGKLLWSFDQVGKGPGEFEYMSFVSYLPKNDQIVFYDNRSKRMNVLSGEGEFLRHFNCDLDCDLLMELPDGRWAINIGKQNTGPGGEAQLQHDVVYMNPDGTITDRFLPHHHNGVGWFWYGESLHQGSRDLLFSSTLQYTVFSLTPEGVDSTWSFDFGDYNADTARYLHPKTRDDYMEPFDNDEILAFRLNHSEKKLWVAVPRNKKPLLLAVVNKKNHEITFYEDPNTNFTYQGIPIMMFYLTQNGNRMVYSIMAIDAIERWENLSDEDKASANPKWRELMENIDPEGNPIICMLYPK